MPDDKINTDKVLAAMEREATVKHWQPFWDYILENATTEALAVGLHAMLEPTMRASFRAGVNAGINIILQRLRDSRLMDENERT